jgi:hypothetical protein
MKKLLFLFLLIVVFVFTAPVLHAAQKAPLGNGNLAVKFDYINFTDDVVKDADVDSDFYIGIEGYVQIVPNLYLGAESGYSNPDGNVMGVKTELTFIPIELNLKYAVEAAPQFAIDFGAGASYNYVEEKVSLFGASLSDDDWLFGGQFFIDMNYNVGGGFFIGANGKYQITEDFKDAGYNYDNWRVGGQIGLMF